MPPPLLPVPPPLPITADAEALAITRLPTITVIAQAGQLEEELSRNGWLTVQADPEIIFSVPPEERFAAAVRLLGIDVAMLSGEAGHA